MTSDPAPPKPYFAYGSNLSAPQMANRCPGATVIAPASLDGHRFLINQRGFATIEHTGDPNDVVWGLLWDVTQKHLDALDGFEGVAAGRYLRETIGAAHTDQADPVAAVVYRDPITDPGAPRTGYLERVISGALAHELPAAYINDVLRPFATK